MAKYPEFPKANEKIEICLDVVAKDLGKNETSS